MAEERVCERCGTGFVPRREHARFCSVPCRVEWNRDHVGDPAAGASALQWSITAMSETAERLPWVGVWDRERAFAALGEAVWWITMVDATLVRHHLAAYDRVMASQAVTERRLIEGTLAGLRFVRNRIGSEADLADFISPSLPGSGTGAQVAAAARPGVGDDAVPRVPGSAGGPHHRGDLRAGRDVPHAGRRGRGPGRRYPRARNALSRRRGSDCPGAGISADSHAS